MVPGYFRGLAVLAVEDSGPSPFARVRRKRGEEQVTEQELQDLLHALLTGEPIALDNLLALGDENPIADVQTFEEAGVSSVDRGLVVRIRDGSEFQIKILRSA